MHVLWGLIEFILLPSNLIALIGALGVLAAHGGEDFGRVKTEGCRGIQVGAKRAPCIKQFGI